jgi:hypothetical protein
VVVIAMRASARGDHRSRLVEHRAAVWELVAQLLQQAHECFGLFVNEGVFVT